MESKKAETDKKLSNENDLRKLIREAFMKEVKPGGMLEQAIKKVGR